MLSIEVPEERLSLEFDPINSWDLELPTYENTSSDLFLANEKIRNLCCFSSGTVLFKY